MTISIWRYSHFTLAISSAFFVIIAAITGIILAIEPISDKLKNFNQADLSTVSVGETISNLQQNYPEIITVEVDKNDFVTASVITVDGDNQRFYINPITGKKIADIPERNPIFEFTTNLHRSLFLKSTGRFLVGFFSLLLFLISATGFILIAKRQGGFSKIFTKVVKENNNQYYHVVFGRLFYIPLVIITLTGVFLSLEKFSWLPEEKTETQFFETDDALESQQINDFPIFKNTNLADLKKIEFPFSDDAEDYFFLQTDNKGLTIQQYTGQVLSEKSAGFLAVLSDYSFILHTGQGSILWAIVLLLSSIVILYFVYSGFAMTLQRVKTKTKKTNQFSKDEAEYIILVGSETGGTFLFAKAFQKALMRLQKKVFLTEMNNYTTFENAKYIIIFTATYGDGDAPANAELFLKKVKKHPPKNKVDFSVVGFGSTNYKEFCKYADVVNNTLNNNQYFTLNTPIFRVNNQSFAEFNKWVLQWKNNNNLPIEITKTDVLNPVKEVDFKIIKKTETNKDDTFLIELKPKKKIDFTSGDLLAITPQNSKNPRLYSIGKFNKNILLSIKKHEFGVCSNYLHGLTTNSICKASVQSNEKFHFPKESKEVILIANGTGIAPFLGMIQHKTKTKIDLFWGCKTVSSYSLYEDYINKALQKGNLNSFEMACSRESNQKVYVQDIVEKQSEKITNFLENGNTIMICGSLKMQKGVESVLEIITQQYLEKPLSFYKENHQIKADCY